MTTNYIVNNINYSNKDLNTIFALGSGALITGYIVNNSNYTTRDLNSIFAPYTTGGLQAKTTNFIANNVNYSNRDLNTIFAPLTTVFPTTNQLYTSSTSFSNFTMPSGKSYFTIVVCGGGGGGNQTNTPNDYGGGGSGGFIYAASIPYTFTGVSTISSISISIGSAGSDASSGGQSTVAVSYNNGQIIQLNAGGGKAVTSTSGTVGGAGGTVSITNTTSWSNSTSIPGATGGAKGANGTKATNPSFTVSGSGANNTATAPQGNPPTGTYTLGIVTVTSKGAGTTQASSGYGAGGANTPANYTVGGVNVASQYRMGTAGCCILLLS